MGLSSRLIAVPLGERTYEIEVGSGNLGGLGGFLLARGRPGHAVIIVDETVRRLYGKSAAASLVQAGIRADLLAVPPGEPTKSVAQADSLWQKLFELDADRQTWIVAVGGGVVGDLAGFVAATYARGLSFVQVPTTLLAQVDSSVGGKVGVNLPGGKNLVGAFWQPRGVLCDVSTLATLPDREYRAGLAEVVKMAVILDPAFLGWLEQNLSDLVVRDAEALGHVVAACCGIKARVVTDDERERTGARAVLNYGHTFAHAFESVAGYGSILHGEAVAIGMDCAARLAERLGRVDRPFVERQRALLLGLGLPVEPPQLDAGAVLSAMSHDKKTEHGELVFILPLRLGEVERVRGVEPAEVRAVLIPESGGVS
jgi:3-dehydroquinate synthase